ncbi:MAG: DUF4358 domain-containing protein, partial [Angelakisella sp.]
MQRFILILTCIIVTVIFALQGFQPKYMLPAVADDSEEVQTENSGAQAPQLAIDDIYFNVSVMGVEDATAERLEQDFGISPFLYTGVWGKYSDGRFGAADVIILQPRPGMEQDVREALQSIKLSRMSLFKNYDIYNAYATCENGSIVERGGYII